MQPDTVGVLVGFAIGLIFGAILAFAFTDLVVR